jgi:very-short-patch-repair endonuclease
VQMDDGGGGDVAGVSQMLAGGLSRHVLRTNLQRGRWQRILPGVVVLHSGPLTDAQRRLAALVYGGRGAALSHRSAAVMLGLRVVEDRVEVTVPHGRPRPATGFVLTHQAIRPLRLVMREGLLCTEASRTVVDVACCMERRDDVRALVSDAIQRGLVTAEALCREAECVPRHSPRWLRLALDEVGLGARSAGEAEFVRLVQRSRLPLPEFNARIETAAGPFLLDALWRDHGIGVEIDGAAWHLGALSWERDLRRQNLIHAAGVTLLRFPVRRLRDDPDGVLSELRAALRTRPSS